MAAAARRVSDEIQKTGWLMMKIAEGVTLVLLGTSFELESIIPALLYLMGLWAVFCKSGVKGWWALIPCARQYKLGLCAGREPEGRMLAAMDFLMVATSLPGLYLQLDSATEMFLALVGLIAALIDIIYQIRVYNGLTEVYGRRKGWVVLWLLLGFIPALLWGFRKAYQPLWKVEDIKSEAANFFSGKKADVLDKGLTVNLEERSVREFFRKKYLLRDIHMYIQPGHMVLLLGGSGGIITWGCAGAALFLLETLLKHVDSIDYLQSRLDGWTQDLDRMTSQTKQSLYAIGSGGATGLGLGNSIEKQLWLPESTNDFIFSVVCEELGFVGAVIVIVLFVLFLVQGFWIAFHAENRFCTLVGIGIMAQIAWQVFCNIAVVTNTLPNTGISLPFFSSGGTSLILLLAEMGVMVNIGRNGERARLEREEAHAERERQRKAKTIVLDTARRAQTEQ